MATITFRGKVQSVHSYPDMSVAYRYVKVPTLQRNHCDMQEFRNHPKYGAFANSDLFDNVLSTIKREHLGEQLRLDRIPANVSIDASGFLALVTLTV